MEYDKQKTALLIMDMQAAIVSMIPDADSFMQHVSEAIKAARQKNIKVIYVVVGFREGAPEISPNNKSFTASKERWTKGDLKEKMKIHDPIAPLPNEIVIIKRRISAFTGSDLEVVLRASGIQHLVLAGIATSGVVLSTVREAADKDYALTVLANGCADMDEEVHRVLITKVFPRQAEVIKIEEWVNAIQ
ncbi:MAG: cysteine hydrolase family protein [Flavisolibacter sp.]